MLTLVAFVLTVAAYVVVVLWCLVTLAKAGRRLVQWVRAIVVLAGLLLLGANVSPVFALPVLLPIYAFGPRVGDWIMAVALFPRTLPIYVENIVQRASATATIIDVAYQIDIDGIRYAPVVRTACTKRSMVDVDALQLHSFDHFSTASGGEFVAHAGNVTLALGQSDLCWMPGVNQQQPGPFPDRWSWIGPVYVVRGDADKTQVYRLDHRRGAIAVDDIALQPPQIVRVAEVRASDVITLDALWPMRQWGESGFGVPRLIEAYQRLPAGVNACVESIYASPDSKTKTPNVSRTHNTRFGAIPVALRSTYCRFELFRRIPAPAASGRLLPIGG
jgi:hypothetical protein